MNLFDIIERLCNKYIKISPFDKIQAEIVVPERKWSEPVALSFTYSEAQQHCNSGYTAYFKNGYLINVKPRNASVSLDEDRQTAYNARYIVSDGITYDLKDPHSIQSIHIPQFKSIEGINIPTRDISYILRMRACGETRNAIAVSLAYKAANLMIASPIYWNKKDYFRIVAQLWSIGEITYGDYLLEELKKRIPSIAAKNEMHMLRRESFEYNLRITKELDQDYIETKSTTCPCPQCAKYRNRIYNLSGKDKRFPKFSDYIPAPEKLCCIQFYGRYYFPGDKLSFCLPIKKGETQEYIEKEVEAIKYSNRPFVDDRNAVEKMNYEEQLLKEQQRKKIEEKFYNKNNWISKYNEKLEYQNILNILPDKAPKSFGGYTRMKKNNTANFQKIRVEAEKQGIKINIGRENAG